MNHQANPFFSVVIPAFNRKDFASAAVESVLAQSFPGFEIIVVDDGSTDGTYEELDRRYSSEPRFRLIRQVNSERGAARNKGYTESHGSYVIFLDSDDVFLPDHLETLHNKITELNNPDFISTKYDLFRHDQASSGSIQNLKEGFYDYHLFLRGNPLAANVCVRRGMDSYVPFEEDRRYAIYEDWFFFLQNLQRKKIYVIDRVTVRMHDHDERSMRSDHQLIISKAMDAIKWIEAKKLLVPEELQLAKGHLYYLCAIHSYLDGHSMRSAKFILDSIRCSGFDRKLFVLLLKLIPGPTLVQRLKKATQAG